MKHLHSIYLLIILCAALSCNRNNEPLIKTKGKEQETLIRVNKYLVGEDQDHIKRFVKRHRWKMQMSQSGLWHMKYQQGNGEKAAKGMTVSIAYTLSLIDGTLCYTVDSLHPKTFTLGKSNDVETGLTEGILMMREGDHARFIMPPHLAHGLTGDNNKIPPRAIIVYDVQLLKLSE